jgi:hypothetical protein
MEQGQQVVLHARSAERATAVADLALRSSGVVIGDLSSAVETPEDRGPGERHRAHGRDHPQRRHIP